MAQPRTPLDLSQISLPRGVVPIVVAVLLLAWVLYSSMFTVPAESVGVLQRFGHYHGEVNPGLHFKMPFGIDRITLVPVKRQLKEEFGFATTGAGFADQSSPPKQWELETTMVTGGGS